MNAAQAKQLAGTYQPLAPDHIRVLVLCPGLPGQQLKGSFELCNLRSSDPDVIYEAISYVCGPPIVAQQFYFSDGQLGIGQNLFEALERFRELHRTRRLWCDAICINQDDSLERSRQVGMMGRIYKLTKRVLVWLGPASASDHLAFATITASKAVQGASRVDRSSQGFFPLIRKELLCNPYCDCCFERVALPANVAIEGLLAVMKLVRGPYFTRVWTIQEAAAGSHVELYCGMHHSSWQDFEWSVRVFYLFNDRPERELGKSYDNTSDFEALDADFYHVDQINRYRENGMQDKLVPSKLVSALMEFSTRNCYDSRDRVYAIRGIEGLGNSKELEPDYGISEKDLYQALASRCLTGVREQEEFSPHISILLALSGTESAAIDKDTWPSWVPSFHHLTERSRTKFRTYLLTDGLQFFSSNVAFRCVQDQASSGSLRIKGRVITRIGDILADSSCPRSYSQLDQADDDYWNDQVTKMVRWYCMCRAFGDSARPSTKCEEEADELYVRLLRCNAYLHNQREMLDWESFADLAVVTPLDEFENQLDTLNLEDVYSALVPYLTLEPQPHLDRWRYLCRTEDGRLGWVPPSARQGDYIAVFDGAPCPFIVRDVADGQYTLIGDAYIDGLSEEECFPAGDAEDHFLVLS
jgi:hypothetical protein